VPAKPVVDFLNEQALHGIAFALIALGFREDDPLEGGEGGARVIGYDWPADSQFGTKAAKHMPDYGMDVRDPAQRDAFRGMIRDIRINPDEVRQGPWNPDAGGGTDYYYYRKGSDVVVTKANGDFVTILKNGSINDWYQRATRV